MRRGGVAIVLVCLTQFSVSAQSIDMDQIAANDAFRWGVSALHDRKINDAIASLNSSLAYDSARSLARYWLGRAYYFGGFEEAALREWRWVAESGQATAVLESWIERTELRRGLTPERVGDQQIPGRYVTMAEVPGVEGDLVIFRRPAMVRPRADGYFYLASFATHQVVLMDPNGVRRQHYDGGLEGFDQPFDVLELDDGSLLVSEFGADRIAVLSSEGFKLGTFGASGIGDGGLLGPQYLASDGNGYLYVSDYGNQRVAKFTTDGEFVLTFGRRSGTFPGLSEPTGLVHLGDRVYIADRARGVVFVFDESGNYLGSVASEGLARPEALSVYNERALLVVDSGKLVVLDIESERVTQIAEFTDRSRIVGAVVDANRNVLATDFDGDRVVFLTAADELYTGLRVEIDYVDAAQHPDVFVAATVVDRDGRPLLGLDINNFRVTENRFSTSALELVTAGYRTGEVAVAMVVDRSQSMASSSEHARRSALEISAAVSGRGKRWLVTAGEQPLVEANPDDGQLAFSDLAAGSVEDYGESAVDLGIRLAASEIMTELGKRGIVLVTDGRLGPDSFDNYELVETAQLLRNNHIAIYVVYTTTTAASSELDYLVEVTGGSSIYLYQPEGSSVLIDDLAAQPSGSYLLVYRSIHDTDFGRRYIPLELEAYLLKRSGRDEAGYFGPLEF